MSRNLIPARKFSDGYNEIVRRGDDPDMLMDFGIVQLQKGQTYTNNEALERVFLLVRGAVKLAYDGKETAVERENCFDFGPWVLSLPAGAEVTITATADDTELTYNATPNERTFPAKLFAPEDSPNEYRGAGTMKEASTRIVRTTFNHSNAPYSNLVIGEVVGYPGKWSSYPPHHHPQPEIYYYKTLPEGGRAYAELGEDVYKLRGNDTLLIEEGLTHSHVTYPGYALWYLWVIRHLDGNPYITPTFVPEFKWVERPDAVIWPDRAEG